MPSQVRLCRNLALSRHRQPLPPPAAHHRGALGRARLSSGWSGGLRLRRSSESRPKGCGARQGEERDTSRTCPEHNWTHPGRFCDASDTSRTRSTRPARQHTSRLRRWLACGPSEIAYVGGVKAWGSGVRPPAPGARARIKSRHQRFCCLRPVAGKEFGQAWRSSGAWGH